LAFSHSFERIGDILKTDIVRHGLYRIELGLTMSEETKSRISEIHEFVKVCLDSIIRHLDDHVGDRKKPSKVLEEIVSKKDFVMTKKDEFHEYLLNERLRADEPDRKKLYLEELGLMDSHIRIYHAVRRLAKKLLASSTGS
jgi:Na+/phosphate symporter